MRPPRDAAFRYPITGIAARWARAANGHADAPPRSVMNSRRLITRSPRRRARAAWAARMCHPIPRLLAADDGVALNFDLGLGNSQGGDGDEGAAGEIV